MKRDSPIYHQNGLAMQGYDMVSLLQEQRIAKGKPDFSYRHAGLEWHFATVAHRDAFAADPERFVPAYGGYCAWGAANGYKAASDIRTFTIMEGRLYFNFSGYIKTHWLSKQAQYIKMASTHWPAIKAQEMIKAIPFFIYLKYLWKGQRFFD